MSMNRRNFFRSLGLATGAAFDIPGKVRKEVQEAVAREISGNLKISIGD